MSGREIDAPVGKIDWKARAERAEAALVQIRDRLGDHSMELLPALADPYAGAACLRISEQVVGTYRTRHEQELDEEGAHWLWSAVHRPDDIGGIG